MSAKDNISHFNPNFYFLKVKLTHNKRHKSKTNPLLDTYTPMQSPPTSEPQKTCSCPLSQYWTHHHAPRKTTFLISISKGLFSCFWTSCKWNHIYVLWLFPLNIIFIISFPVVACRDSLSILITVQYFIMWMCCNCWNPFYCLMNIWVVSSFTLLWLMLLWTFL